VYELFFGGYVFDTLKKAVENKYELMKAHTLYRTGVDRDMLWDTYLNSFPAGTNPIYKERTEHDCTCCKSFIKSVGNMVAIIDGKLVSIWDIEIDNFYQEVANALSTIVKEHPITNVFLYSDYTAGTDANFVPYNDSVITWKHFYLKLDPAHRATKTNIGPRLGEYRASFDVLFRSLSEITLDAAITVMDLIKQNSIYRGEEHRFVVGEFIRLKSCFDAATSKETYCWSVVPKLTNSVSRIRNTAIGTLLVDISGGRELEDAVKAFEHMVAPTNYKRPTAIVSKSMIENAKKKVDELGFSESLHRRFATIEDLTINNVLFADRSAKQKMSNIFDEVAASIPVKSKNLDKVEEVSIEKFISDILPSAESIELMVENRHTSNLCSLIAPVNFDSSNMFKWPNSFSWSYAGNLTDSIKERVKRAGGSVDCYLRCSLSWFNTDDLDLHMEEPSGQSIYYGSKISNLTGGNLDVDMNVGNPITTPVENIQYPSKDQMVDGEYFLKVNNYQKRNSHDYGFEVEIEVDGNTTSIVYDKPLNLRETITVAIIKYSKSTGTSVTPLLPVSTKSKNVWGIDTHNFHKVSMVLLSPNHWDSSRVGNKHFLFILDGCKNIEPTRGFFNEYLREDLNEHRKVLELVGSRMLVEPSDNQLSGLGFSSTQRNSVLCRVKGSFSRIIKLTF